MMTPASIPPLYYIVAAIVVVAIVAIAVVAARRNRSAHLAQRFGPEYKRLVHERGAGAAEKELVRREERRKRFHIGELPGGARDRYVEEWRTVQSRFVDEPKSALSQADALVTNVMRDRGYPIVNFEQRAADISTDHAGVVQHYRAAHTIAEHNDRGEASTEDLRRAMIHYRKLFGELVGDKDVTS